MLCQKCHKKTASVFISSIINGQETRMYLCSDCAKDYPLFNFNFQEPFSIKDVMDKFNIDEKAILISTQLYVAFALEALKKENKKHILISKIKEEKWN